ncbi:hypothetical protein CH286_16340 [Rhodococcus sp. WWJCD1]|uniref:LacI family DNA-binding transcriptional regulator n=1 Tax=Rhodococcus sp. WWJCD1 TaxID=2022519 RepID=UPI000B9A7375|nr:LacI family DNA-binding transcriptional regulator [Rhodococcus sp. WWJCD1]OZC46326.1 hypothetical protein CH286_16340 [Rhodococcus sp. WWJCD1]
MAGGGRAKITDVARAAGVSVTTVSHALNGKGRVDAQTRSHVQQVAAQLQYVPSRAARHLVAGGSDVVGLTFPSIARLPIGELMSTDWYSQVALTASQAAFEHGGALTLLPPFVETMNLSKFGLRGVVVLEPTRGDLRTEMLRQSAIPYVTMGLDPGHPDVLTVTPDTAHGIEKLLSHLRAMGAQRIAVLSTDSGWHNEVVATEAAREWASVNRCALKLRTVALAEQDTRAGIVGAARAATYDLLTSDEVPDAIVGLFEDFGIGILDAASQLGLRVPADLLVAQDVDGFKAQHSRPPITALDLHASEQVASAIDLLISDSPSASITVPTTLRIRESSSR